MITLAFNGEEAQIGPLTQYFTHVQRGLRAETAGKPCSPTLFSPLREAFCAELHVWNKCILMKRHVDPPASTTVSFP